MINVERLNRFMLEATWSADQAVSWAEEHHRRCGKWPCRRWRVEIMGMRSRLLGRRAAERTQLRYGGRIVEVIPLRSAFKRLARAEASS